MTIIYHIAYETDWRAAQGLGFYKGGDTFDKEGFIHFSIAEEIKVSAELHYQGMADLLLIAVFDYKLGTALKWERTRGGKLFPHVIYNKRQKWDEQISRWKISYPIKFKNDDNKLRAEYLISSCHLNTSPSTRDRQKSHKPAWG